MPFGPELLDVTRHANPVRRDTGPRGSPLVADPNWSNVKRFRDAIEVLLAGATFPTGGILYLPPGRYLIENDLPEAWVENLWNRSRRGDHRPDLRAERLNHNVFGASLRFPAGITLWLAPGAVLVPADGAIVHIESDLVCDPIQVFDLSLGGLIVFGNRVPKLLPQWWGVYPGEDHALAIQAAIDAGIHNRSILWEGGGNGTVASHEEVGTSLPYIPIELRGEYRLRQPVTVRGASTSNQLLQILGDRTVEQPSRRLISPILANTVIAGVWSGRDARGARLVADRPFSGETLLRLTSTIGLTLRNVAFEVGAAVGPTCLDIMPSAGNAVMRGMAVRGCSFTGDDATLVRFGPTPSNVVPGSLALGTRTRADVTTFSMDASCLAFDECEFRPRSGGIGLTVRGVESLPFRLRTCDFVGVARAMISAWMGGFLLDGCRFDNRPPAAERPPADLGFEEPDGADVYLRFDPPSLQPGSSSVLVPSSTSRTAFFTATGCVSQSPRFLSTVRPRPGINQRVESPILLLNVRHVSPRANKASVRWGLTNEVSSITSVGDRRTARLGRASPLVILGGQYSGYFEALPGAADSVVVGPRSENSEIHGGWMKIEPTDIRGVGFAQPTDIFGLAYDRLYR